MKQSFRIALCFGALPLIGWLASLFFSLIATGSLFSWSPVSYAPLMIISLPLEGLYRQMTRFLGGESHGGVLLFAVIASITYTVLAIMVLSPIWVSKWLRERNATERER